MFDMEMLELYRLRIGKSYNRDQSNFDLKHCTVGDINEIVVRLTRSNRIPNTDPLDRGPLDQFIISKYFEWFKEKKRIVLTSLSKTNSS